MAVSEKIKTANNKTEQNKAQYDLDRQTAKNFALSLRNVSKYEFLTGKDVLPEKDVLEKAATLKRFEYSPLGKELKALTDITEKQYQKLRDTYEFDKIIKKEKPTLENYSKSDLIYNNNYSFYKYYCDSEKLDNLSLESKYAFLAEFFNHLDNQKIKKTNLYNTS